MHRYRNNKPAFILTILSLLVLAGLLCPARGFAQAVCPLDSLKPKKVGNLDEFRKIPILSEGRIKPMETFAENFLLRISGRRRYKKESAVEWFARYLFAPRTTYNDKIFLINNPDILEAIHVEPEKRRRYSYRQLEPGYDKIRELAEVVHSIDDKERSVVEREIMRLFDNLSYYISISGALTYGFPHPDFTITNPETIALLGLPNDREEFSFYDIFIKMDALGQAASQLKGVQPAEATPVQQDVQRLVNAMFFWTNHYSDCPLGLIPTINPVDEQWLSPVDTINLQVPNEDIMEEITQIRNMVVHYWNAEQLQFDIAARAFENSVKSRLTGKEKTALTKIPKELFYNHLKPFFWAKFLYLIAFFLVLYSLLSDGKGIYKTAIGFTVAAFTIHACGLLLRIMILSRPPVSNLFETFIFVGLIGAILGLIIEKINKNWLGLAVASTSGLIFLLISGKFAAEGDTLQMLVAVLNSNFWLSTHVLSITTGYAGCCVTAILGHIYILQLLFKPNNTQQHEKTFNNMMGLLAFGLTMSVLGTALGGIWADQSWGRFWGWDPKENGALLIVLWCAIIFHARIAKLINPLGVAVGCVMGLIVVMWAWFGVNLLSVGLHSYGFTSGIANALAIYVICELIFLSVTVILLGKRNIKI